MAEGGGVKAEREAAKRERAPTVMILFKLSQLNRILNHECVTLES